MHTLPVGVIKTNEYIIIRNNNHRHAHAVTPRTSCRTITNQTFLGSGGRNESYSHYLVLISVVKIFHEHDVHRVLKQGIKRFWSKEPQMSLRAITLFESVR